MDDVFDLLSDGDLYKVLRLVMVNSGSAAYVEIPIDETAALLSKNNKGKTSALNALKLFLLPEINFKACEKKFGFSSGGKVYTGEESFSYYFPSATSFIILEATNTQGDFCIVLHQNPKEALGYNRIAVPKSYADIRHLFWDTQSDANQGMGSHPADLNLSTVHQQLMAQKGIALIDQESIRTALYTRVSPTKPETRFCLMPLVQLPKPPMMRSIKALLQLSFDIKGANTKNLPLAIANIIDSEISTSKEPINIDFKRIHSERERLRQEANHIHNVKNHQQNWLALGKSYRDYGLNLRAWHKDVAGLSGAIVTLLNQFQPEHETAQEQLQGLVSDRKRIEKNLASKTAEISTKNGERKPIVKDLEKLNTSIELAKEVIAREGPVIDSQDAFDISNYLREIKKEAEVELESFQNREKANARLEVLVGNKTKLVTKIKLLDQQLAEDSQGFLSFLDEHSATILNSLNTGFKGLSQEPMFVQTQAIECFAELFELENDQVLFCGEVLDNFQIKSFDVQSFRDNIIAELDKLRDQQEKNEKSIDELNRLIKAGGELSTALVEEKHQELKEIDGEIKALASLDRDQEDLQEKQLTLAALDDYLESLEVEKDNLNNQYIECFAIEEETRKKVTSIEKNFERIKQCDTQLQYLKKLIAEDGETVSETVDSDLVLSVDEVEQHLGTLETLQNTLKNDKQKSLEKFRAIISGNVLALDAELAHRTDLESNDFSDAYQKLRSEFENIDSKEKEHLIQVRNHNHETSVEISLLDNMARAIKNFEERINAQLGSVKISNLTGVTIEIKTLDGFNTLRRELANHGSTSDQLMEDSFYQRLMDFCEQYLTTGSGYGKLDLEKIVTDVKFVYEINGKKESTSQSNGTSGMVNAVLLAILMRRLVPEDVTFTLPVVFDEIGSLDEDNLPELRRVVEFNHFVLLVANPNNNGYIAQHIGRWHDVYLHNVTEGEVVNKCLAIYVAETESLKTVESQASFELA